MTKEYFLYNDNIGKIELVQSMGEDITVVNSARVSFGVHKKEVDEKDENLIKYLIKNRHTSTLEHNTATFRIKVPLFVRSQHHRHRTWSYNEISRRYTDINIEFYTPKNFRTQHASNRQASNSLELINPNVDTNNWSGFGKASEIYEDHCNDSLVMFNNLIEQGVCKEQARGVLPQAMYTEYYATANLSNILKFITLRTHEGAQWEIQKLAESMLEIITKLWPVTVGCYRELNNV
jgi:thymidylate synthase (FAD)